MGILGGGDKGEGTWDVDSARLLDSIVSRLRGRSRAVYAGQDKIEVIQPNGSGKMPVPESIVHLCDDGYSVLFFGATQGVEIRDKGTYASATVHEGVELRKVSKYAGTLGDSFQFGTIRPWYFLNYADGPEF